MSWVQGECRAMLKLIKVNCFDMIELNTIYNEPCLETIKRFEPNSIDCVITSPPYWMCRDYGYPEQWGLEPTFTEYLEHLWQLMDALMPKLKSTATLWINLGDVYGTVSQNMTSGNVIPNKIKYTGGIKDYAKPTGFNKCLLLLPHRFAIGCIDRGYVMRNDIVWAKRNGMPESVTDRFSKKHEYFFFMTKSTDYYFDLDVVKDKTKTFDKNKRDRETTKLNNTPGRTRMGGLKENNYNAKNPGTISDFWDIPTKPSASAHYAQYNDKLISKPILAGCPKGGLIYDPFMGTGTTALAAIKYQRNFVGSEMSEEYLKIANSFIKPSLTQTHLF